MAQVKKAEVRQAILDAAFGLFERHGYQGTSMQAIAREANVSVANVYVYFGSKLDMLYAVYDPWMRARLERLAADLARMPDPRARLRALFAALWREIPAEANGFVNNIMQALATSTPAEGYRPLLVDWMEARITAMLESCLPAASREAAGSQRLAHLAVMALDGFTLYRRHNPARECDDDTLDLMCDLVLGPAPGSPSARAASRAQPRATSRAHPRAASRAHPKETSS